MRIARLVCHRGACPDQADTFLTHESHSPVDVLAARREAISFAAYRLLRSRFLTSPGSAETLPSLDAKMAELVALYNFENDATFTSIVGNSPAAIGNRIGFNVSQNFANDGANEAGDYVNQFYSPVNDPLFPDFPGNPDITDANRWQPLVLEFFVDQSGNPHPLGEYPEFLGRSFCSGPVARRRVADGQGRDIDHHAVRGIEVRRPRGHQLEAPLRAGERHEQAVVRDVLHGNIGNRNGDSRSAFSRV